MKGIKAKDLVSIIDFIYYGETNICQEDLHGFLNFVKEIQLKGLVGTKTAKEEIINTINYNHNVDINLLNREIKPNNIIDTRSLALIPFIYIRG